MTSKTLFKAWFDNICDFSYSVENRIKKDYCRLESYEVKVRDLGLSERILSPAKLRLNKCVGKCDLISVIDADQVMTNHARMMALRLVLVPFFYCAAEPLFYAYLLIKVQISFSI